MSASPADLRLWLLLGAAGLLLLLGTWLGFRLRAWRERLRAERLRRQGERGEADAGAWLKRNGFRDIRAQNESRHRFKVDDTAHDFTVRPDFFAERAGAEWLIEVKTGRAASPDCKESRRQLREYAALHPGLRYGLFDATAGVLHEIAFPEQQDDKAAAEGGQSAHNFVWGLVIGFIAGAALLWHFTRAAG